MTAPRYVIAELKTFDGQQVLTAYRDGLCVLPDVPVGTSIRLERTEDGWTDRGVLRPYRRSVFDDMWVDAPSTETNE